MSHRPPPPHHLYCFPSTITTTFLFFPSTTTTATFLLFFPHKQHISVVFPPPPPPHFYCFPSTTTTTTFPLFPSTPPHFYCFPPQPPLFYCFSCTTTTTTFLLFSLQHHHISIVFLRHHHHSMKQRPHTCGRFSNSFSQLSYSSKTSEGMSKSKVINWLKFMTSSHNSWMTRLECRTIYEFRNNRKNWKIKPWINTWINYDIVMTK